MKNKILLIILFTGITVLPVSDYSLWIDEATTAFMASQQSFDDLYQTLTSANTSEVQMPGYILFIWGWEKISGYSEYALRLSNVFFMALVFTFLFYSPLPNRFKIIASTIIALLPFIWYNMNEVRSNIPVFALAAISLLSLLYYFQGNKKYQKLALWFFPISVIVGLSFNMLFLFYVPVLMLIYFLFIYQYELRIKKVLNDWWISITIIAVLGAVILAYYVWTLTRGAGGVVETPGLANLAFVIYEFMGFSGVGPPRNILREDQSLQTLKPFLPMVGLLLLSYLLLFLFVIRGLKTKLQVQKAITNPFLISFIAGSVIFLAVAFVFSFRFWGRHMIFLLPVFIFYMVSLINLSFGSDKLATKGLKIVGGLFLVVFLISNYNIRLKDIYQKENVKLAAITAKNIVGNDGYVIWTEHPYLASYYGIGAEKAAPSWKISSANIVTVNSIQDLDSLLNPHLNTPSCLVLFEKARDYDKDKTFRNFIENNNLKVLYKDHAFRIYDMNETIPIVDNVH